MITVNNPVLSFKFHEDCEGRLDVARGSTLMRDHVKSAIKEREE